MSENLGFFKPLWNSSKNVLKAFLTHFRLMFYLYTPQKRQKPKGFLTFSGCREMEHWASSLGYCLSSSKMALKIFGTDTFCHI